MTLVRPLSAAKSSIVYNQAICLDTSMLFNLAKYPETNPRYQKTLEFTNDVAKADAFLVATVKQIEELTIRLTREETTQLQQERKIILEQDPTIGEKINARVQAITKLLETNPAYISEPQGTIDSTILKRAQEILSKYNVQWGDSVTFAIAEQLQADGIASWDFDYTRIQDSDMPLYIPQFLYDRYLKQSSSKALSKPIP